MSEYTTPDEVRLALSRTLDDEDTAGNAASLKSVTIQEQIEDASVQIDGALGTRWKVPFDEPVPRLIRNIARDIAAYLCDLIYREIRDYGSANDNPVVLRYKRAIDQLAALASGKMIIPDLPPPVDGTTPTGGSMVAFEGGELQFTGQEFKRPYGDPYRRPTFFGQIE